LQHCSYDLQAVLYPMIDFIEQDLLAVEGHPELAFIPLSLDRHPCAAWKATLKVTCPHCGEVHEISVRETYINGVLSDAADQLRHVI
jgi:hypothetical protein